MRLSNRKIWVKQQRRYRGARFKPQAYMIIPLMLTSLLADSIGMPVMEEYGWDCTFWRDMGFTSEYGKLIKLSMKKYL